ncbi:isochorismatase family protein [Mycoplasmatota bacterium]|nr:isochorismatase family protein [Mycoplasmatota bacterium]
MNETIKNMGLLVVDVQKGLFYQKTPVYKEKELLCYINHLIDIARTNQLPIIFIQHSNKGILKEGCDGWNLHPELKPLEHEPIILKSNASAFNDTILNKLLVKKNINKLFVVGLTTHGCVKVTCTDALKLGYDVTLVSDAHSSFSEKAAQLIETWNKKLLDKGIKLISTNKLISVLNGNK